MINYISGLLSIVSSDKKKARQRKADRRTALAEALEPRTLLSTTPTGAVAVFSNATISGWAFNSDDGSLPVNIVITINGNSTTLSANQNEVLNTTLGSPLHGFSFTVPTLPPGKSNVTVKAVSTTSGTSKILKSGTLTNPAPTGAITLSKDGSTLSGYVHDADSANPIQVRTDVDGVAGTPFTTNLLNPAAANKFHTGSLTLGFSQTGSFLGHVVEVYAIDAPSNTPVLLFTNNKKPTGKVTINDGFSVQGYAFDPNSGATPIDVEVTVDGVLLSGTPSLANINNASLQKTLGSIDHGFNIAIPGLTPGKHTINVYALDGQAGAQAPVLIGSKTVTNAVPTGGLLSVTNSTITGWALDPDLGTAPTTVNLYVDDSIFNDAPITASANLPGLSGSKKGHGFSIDISSLPTGSHSITLTVIDNRTSDGSEVVFYDSFINNHKPIGSFESANGTTLTGWAYDPDTADQPIPVDIYVDGVYAQTVSADVSRSDVPQLQSLPNNDHGFTANLPALSFGTHRIDIYASESQGNVSVLLGSKTVTNARPIGAVESIDTTTLIGWAADPDVIGTSVQVEVFVNGGLAVTGTANIARPDLLTNPPLSSDPNFDNYGYSLTLTGLVSGNNQVDVYAVDPNNGMLSPIKSQVVAM